MADKTAPSTDKMADKAVKQSPINPTQGGPPPVAPLPKQPVTRK